MLIEFRCQECKNLIDVLLPKEEIPEGCICGGLLERVYCTPPFMKVKFRPYLTQTMDKKGKRTYLETEREASEWSKRNDVVLEYA